MAPTKRALTTQALTTRAGKRPARTERGAATPLLAAGVATVVVCAVGVLRVGEAAAQRARADAVADLSALAHVTGGLEGATAVAHANGAVVTGHRRTGTARVVTIGLDGVLATAAARPAGSPR